jgi:chemotaxis protein CheX
MSQRELQMNQTDNAPGRTCVDQYGPLLVASTLDVFETMLFVPVGAETALSEKKTDFVTSVSGLIGLSGECRGMLAIHCPDRAAIKMTEALLGEPCVSIDDVKDTIGEMINMIAGGFKSRALELPLVLDISVPSICAGTCYSISGLAQADWVMIPFRIEEDVFWVELKLVKS